MIYSLDQQNSILYQAQVWMADMGVKLEALERSMQPCDDLYCLNYKVRVLITAIQKTGDLEDFEEELLYTCLVESTGIKDYPVFPAIAVVDAPDVIIGQPGPTGPSGADGVNGTNANVGMVSLDDEIVITSAVNALDPNKVDWFFKHDPYSEPAISLSLSPSTTVIEIGNTPNIQLNMTLLKGREDVETSVITSDSGLNTAYQNIPLDLATLNAGGPTGRSIVASAVAVTTTFTVNITDGVPETNTASRTVTFVYPFLFGNTDITNPVFYSALSDLIQVKGTKAVLFDAEDDYFWFGYPDSYGDLTSIKDQNGFEMLGVSPAFVKSAELVTSTSLTNNWVDVGYTFYRTIAKTTINGTYTFTF